MKNKILFLLGITIFFLVLCVLYLVILLSQYNQDFLFIFAPFVFLSGFFIFLIAAFLVAMSVSNIISKVVKK